MKKFLRKTARITLALAPVYFWNMNLQARTNRNREHHSRELESY